MSRFSCHMWFWWLRGRRSCLRVARGELGEVSCWTHNQSESGPTVSRTPHCQFIGNADNSVWGAHCCCCCDAEPRTVQPLNGGIYVETRAPCGLSGRRCERTECASTIDPAYWLPLQQILCLQRRNVGVGVLREAIAHESINLESFLVTLQPDAHGSSLFCAVGLVLGQNPLAIALLLLRSSTLTKEKKKRGWTDPQFSKNHDCDTRDLPLVCAVHFVFSKFYCNVPFLVYCSFFISFNSSFQVLLRMIQIVWLLISFSCTNESMLSYE